MQHSDCSSYVSQPVQGDDDRFQSVSIATHNFVWMLFKICIFFCKLDSLQGRRRRPNKSRRIFFNMLISMLTSTRRKCNALANGMTSTEDNELRTMVTIIP